MHSGLGEDLDVDRLRAGGGDFVDGLADFGQELGDGVGLVGADGAVDVPEVHAGGNGFAALTFHIAADVGLDAVEDAGVGFAGEVQREGFLHGFGRRVHVLERGERRREKGRRGTRRSRGQGGRRKDDWDLAGSPAPLSRARDDSADCTTTGFSLRLLVPL